MLFPLFLAIILLCGLFPVIACAIALFVNRPDKFYKN